MARLFGTDGVRGVANVELTPELAFKLGRAAASYFGRETRNPKIIIGRERASALRAAMRIFWALSRRRLFRT